MKTISQEVSLAGKLEQITMSDLRTRPGEVIDSVELGKTYVISKAGKPIAVLSKLPGDLVAVVNRAGKTESYRLPS